MGRAVVLRGTCNCLFPGTCCRLDPCNFSAVPKAWCCQSATTAKSSLVEQRRVCGTVAPKGSPHTRERLI